MITFTFGDSIIESGYVPTIPKKKRYLGAKAEHDKCSKYTIVLLLETEAERTQFLSFWRDGLNYGTDAFLISLPMFGISGTIAVTIENDLSEKVKCKSSEITLNLVQINNNKLEDIPEWEIKGVVKCATQILAVPPNDESSGLVVDFGIDTDIILLSVSSGGVGDALAFDVELSASNGVMYKSVYCTEPLDDSFGFRVDAVDKITAKITNHSDADIGTMPITVCYIIL